jgi:hypothetical protein
MLLGSEIDVTPEKFLELAIRPSRLVSFAVARVRSSIDLAGRTQGTRSLRENFLNSIGRESIKVNRPSQATEGIIEKE